MRYNKEGDENMLRTCHMELTFDSDKEFPDLRDIVDNIVELIDLSIVEID